MSEKIFCGNCRYSIDWICKHNPNIITSWHGRGPNYAACSDKNQDNDCEEFSPSFWFWLKRKIFRSTP